MWKKTRLRISIARIEGTKMTLSELLKQIDECIAKKEQKSKIKHRWISEFDYGVYCGLKIAESLTENKIKESESD